MKNLTLVDTNDVVMHLIHQTIRGNIRVFDARSTKIFQQVSWELSSNVLATLQVDDHDQNSKLQQGNIRLYKGGHEHIRGFFCQQKTPLLFEYAQDFCKHVLLGTHLTPKELFKEAMLDFDLF